MEGSVCTRVGSLLSLNYLLKPLPSPSLSACLVAELVATQNKGQPLATTSVCF